VADQPPFDRRCLVSGVVVEDQMNREVVGDLGVDTFEELLELGCAMVSVQRADHLA